MEGQQEILYIWCHQICLHSQTDEFMDETQGILQSLSKGIGLQIENRFAGLLTQFQLAVTPCFQMIIVCVCNVSVTAHQLLGNYTASAVAHAPFIIQG